jgi:hypothetical protein
MKSFKTLLGSLILAASAISTLHPAAAQVRRVNALVMLEDADPETMSRNVAIYRRVLPQLQEDLSTRGVQVYDENINAIAFQRPDKRRRSDVELVTIARAVAQSQPLDVVILFSIVASAQQDVVVPSILHPKVRIPGRVINIHSGQLVGAFEVNPTRLPVLPNPCDNVCLTEEVGNDAKLIADDLADALATKLAGFTSGGIAPLSGGPGDLPPPPLGPPPGPGPGPEGPVVVGGPVGGPPPQAGCDALPGDIKIAVRNFLPGELMEVERNLRQFGCFNALTPIRSGATFAEYAYNTSAGMARIDRNLRVMLDYLGLRGQVSFDGNEFQVTKIGTRQ